MPEAPDEPTALGLRDAPGHLLYIGSGWQIATYADLLISEMQRYAFRFDEFQRRQREGITGTVRKILALYPQNPTIFFAHRFCVTDRSTQARSGVDLLVKETRPRVELSRESKVALSVDPTGRGIVINPTDFVWASPDPSDEDLGLVKLSKLRRAMKGSENASTSFRTELAVGNLSSDYRRLLDDGVFPAADGHYHVNPIDGELSLLDCQVIKLWRLAPMKTSGDLFGKALMHSYSWVLTRRAGELVYTSGTGDSFWHADEDPETSVLFHRWIARHHHRFRP